MSDFEVETVVVGAGVVGLAIARALALRGQEVVILEAEASWGQHTSSRNSQVIHAGIYYPRGSLKARLCVEGKRRLYDYCVSRHIPHRNCEKLIVATDASQLEALDALTEKGRANGVDDLEILSGRAAMALEPELSCIGAIRSPSTGIVDASALMRSLLGDAQAAGAAIAYRSPLVASQITEAGFDLSVGDTAGTSMSCRTLINAAGLGSWGLARAMEGFDQGTIPPESPVKGTYFTLTSGKAPFKTLIYPMPDAVSLGVHYVIDTGGQASFGPTVMPGALSGIDYAVAEDPRAYEAGIRKFWPGLPEGALVADRTGIRPRVTSPGDPLADFMILGPTAHGHPGLVHLFGIESPGLTSCLAIAERVADMFEA